VIGARLRSWSQKIKQHPFIATGIIVVLLAIIAFILAVNTFGWNWTGFNGGYSKVTITNTPQGTTTTTELQSTRTLWDWLGLLAVPVVVGFGVAWFTAQQGKVSDAENKDNQRATSLQAYIDKMSDLLLKENLPTSHSDDLISQSNHKVRYAARARTLTVLTGLDGRRKGNLILFLYESDLIDAKNCIIDLSNADLRGADLSDTTLNSINLSKANLSDANLSGTLLHKADLRGANLSNANLSNAKLIEANLSEVNKKEMFLSHNRSYAEKAGTNLSRANLQRAFLVESNLEGANLTGAKVTKEQLETVKSLKDAIMDDVSKHP